MNLVCRGADLDAAVEAAVVVCFRHSATHTSNAKRILVDDAVYQRFVDKLVRRTQTLRFGDPADARTDVGPLDSADAREQLVDWVDDAWTRGAQVHQCGPHHGLFYPATVLADVTPAMLIGRVPIDGPVAAVLRASDVAGERTPPGGDNELQPDAEACAA